MRWLWIAILAGALGVSQGANAASPDHERARAALEAGEILPLQEILSKVDEQFEGRVIEVRLSDFEEGLHGWIYAITLLSPQDNVLILKVDAGTGVILKVVGHGIAEARKPQ
ncbi:MAG: PepSY domain-containing protein [Alphaproteobacteria bacterium]